MTKTSDKIIGKTKEVIAEVVGDGKLAEEGKSQKNTGEKPVEIGPIERLGKLT